MEVNDLKPIQEDLRGFELYELYICYVYNIFVGQTGYLWAEDRWNQDWSP